MIRHSRVGPIALLQHASILPVSILLVSLLAACRTLPPPLPTGGTPLAIDDARATRVLGEYLSTIEGRRALRGSARVALSGPDYRLDRPQRIVVERPARLRFEILGLFDQLAAILATNGERFDFFEAATGEITRGRVSSTLLWDLAKIDVTAAEAVGLLLGSPAPESGLARSAVWLESDGRIALAFAWPLDDPPAACESDPHSGLVEPACFVKPSALALGGEVFVFDELGRLVEVRSLEAEGVLRYRAVFEQYEALAKSDGVVFPKRITIDSPAVAAEARFDWKRVMLAGPLSDRLFSLPDPQRSERRP